MQRIRTTNSVLLKSGIRLVYKVIPPSRLELVDHNWFNTNQSGYLIDQTRIAELLDKGFVFEFKKIESRMMFLNIQLLDSELPRIIAALVILKYKYNRSDMSDLLALIEIENPIEYNLEYGHVFYKEKIARLLYNLVSGMNAKIVWHGNDNIDYGKDINISNNAYYNMYDRNLFLDYLINNTKLEHVSKVDNRHKPSYAKRNKYDYNLLYEEDGVKYLKLNLQIRIV